MRSILLASSAALALAGCQSTSTKVDSSIQQALSGICPAVQQAHAAFLIAATANAKAAKVAGKEAQAYAAVEVACIDPSNVNSSNLLVYIATAYAAWEIAGVK